MFLLLFHVISKEYAIAKGQSLRIKLCVMLPPTTPFKQE